MMNNIFLEAPSHLDSAGPAHRRTRAAAIRWLMGTMLAALCACPASWAEPSTGTAELKLHVPSPDWRDQVIYFLMTDRFNDGDPTNNDQGVGEFGPDDAGKYSGGDLRGVEQKIDYIKGLGATAVWITPPVANLWWSPRVKYGGYHGYWAENFMEVDRHLGTLDDYKRLSHALHSNGMYLVQDIVLNHTGDFFHYDGAWNPRDPSDHFARNLEALPHTAPTQWPFSLNDARNPVHRKAGIYHWTPDVADFGDRHQELNYQMAGLDDLKTENPVVRAALRKSHGYWIREVGVDAFRVDTAFYVPPDLFRDFIFSTDPLAPGMEAVARQTGREHFHLFGEGFGIDKPFEVKQARKIDSYMRDARGRPLMPGMLNFPLYGAINDTFARGRPPAEMAHRIQAMMKEHANPHLMPSFLDNHDVDRFLAGGNEAGLRQGLLLMLTLPGIPVIYSGTEQGFSERQQAMFKGGFHSAGVDHFDVEAPLYRFVQRATALRRDHPVFSRGTPEGLRGSASGPGVLTYRMRHEKSTALVVFNSADADTLLDQLDTGLPEGTPLTLLFDLDGSGRDLVVGPQGRVTLRLPARSAMVWQAGGSLAEAAPGGSARRNPAVASVTHVCASPQEVALALDALRASRVQGDFPVTGEACGMARFKLVVDGDLAHARDVTVGSRGLWHAFVDTSRMVDPSIEHSVVAWDEPTGKVSPTRSFRVTRQWRLLATLDDPAGDDRGPSGNYAYPTDPGWGAHRQMDIRQVKVWSSGGALKIDVTMHELTTSWSPANGFDHMVLTMFLELPGQAEGSDVMPLQNARLPDGMHWNLRLRTHGWANAAFSSDGAGPLSEGRTIAPAADVKTNAARQTISVVIPAATLGNPVSTSKMRLYLNTWDYDGTYRALTQKASPHGMSGGDGKVDPLIMDDIKVITLP
jgi:glycosidase